MEPSDLNSLISTESNMRLIGRIMMSMNSTQKKAFKDILKTTCNEFDVKRLFGLKKI